MSNKTISIEKDRIGFWLRAKKVRGIAIYHNLDGVNFSLNMKKEELQLIFNQLKKLGFE